MVQFFPDREENIVGKGENAGYQHFLLFPRCFQKASNFKVVWDCGESAKNTDTHLTSAEIMTNVPKKKKLVAKAENAGYI